MRRNLHRLRPVQPCVSIAGFEILHCATHDADDPTRMGVAVDRVLAHSRRTSARATHDLGNSRLDELPVLTSRRDELMRRRVLVAVIEPASNKKMPRVSCAGDTRAMHNREALMN